MDSNRIEGDWKQLSGQAKTKWGKLTDDHLTQVNGQTEQLVGKIQEAYGIGKDEAQRQVREWTASLKQSSGSPYAARATGCTGSSVSTTGMRSTGLPSLRARPACTQALCAHTSSTPSKAGSQASGNSSSSQAGMAMR